MYRPLIHLLHLKRKEKSISNYRVDAKNGYAEEELRVDVVEKMIPSVSLIPAYSTYMGKERNPRIFRKFH